MLHCLKDIENLLLNRIQSGLGAENIFSYLTPVEKWPGCNSFLAATPNVPKGRGSLCCKPFSREGIHGGFCYMVLSRAQFDFTSSFQQS